jgi:excisionase family DNA binding protein
VAVADLPPLTDLSTLPLVLRATEVASLLRVSVRTLDSWLAAKKVPPPIPGLGRRRRWSRDAIAAILQPKQ